jgi:hypothetical protein
VVGKILENKSETFGFDAQTEEYVDMVEKGIIDPGQGGAHRAAGRFLRRRPAGDAPKPWSPNCRRSRRRRCHGGGGGMGGMGGMGFLSPACEIKSKAASGRPSFWPMVEFAITTTILILCEEFTMRRSALPVALTASPNSLSPNETAQTPARPTKSAISPDRRLMDGNADVDPERDRQGKTVTSAVLDVCYPVEKGSDRKDRFVANLSVSGATLTGSTQSLADKLPVTVKLARKASGDSFEFRGQITIGQAVTEVTSTDNSDLSEKEFLENQTTDDGITPGTEGFHRSVAGIDRRAGEAGGGAGFPQKPEGRGHRGQPEQPVGFLRRHARPGQQTISLTVDPALASALIAKAKSSPGIVSAGWTSGSVEMDRSIRFAAGDWRNGDRINKDKIATTVAGVLSKTLIATAAGAAWNANTGKLKLTFKRPSQTYPALGLTDSIEVTALVSPDKPGATDRLILWISSPVTTTTDENAGPKLNLSEGSSGDEEGGEPEDDNGSVEALAREFKGQRWDADKSVWK